MITKKEDLINTYIINDEAELRDLYSSLCDKFGIKKFRDCKLNLDVIAVFSSDLGLNDPWELIDMELNEERDDMRELTIEDLKPQTKEVEWVNGLPPVGVECEWIGGGLNHGDWGLVVVHAYHNDSAWIEKLHNNSMHTVVNPAHFREPETPEQKLEREELEAAYDLYCYAIDKETLFDSFCNFGPLKDIYIKIVRKTNYKVKGEQ